MLGVEDVPRIKISIDAAALEQDPNSQLLM